MSPSDLGPIITRYHQLLMVRQPSEVWRIFEFHVLETSRRLQAQFVVMQRELIWKLRERAPVWGAFVSLRAVESELLILARLQLLVHSAHMEARLFEDAARS